MRLIDADSVIEAIGYYIGKKIYASYPNDKMPDFDKGMIDGYARARSIVFETPTVDPVKHGRWRKMNGERGYECSECGWESDTTWDFCPNCGALNIEAWGNTDEVEE